MKEVKRPVKYHVMEELINTKYFLSNRESARSGFNDCHSEWEEFMDYVMEPIRNIKERGSDSEKWYCDTMNAIQESVRRSNNGK